MISGMFPADLKPRFKLCNDGAGASMYFWQCYGAKAARAASLWVQLLKRGPAAKPANQRHCDDATGKDMGSRRQDYGFCRNLLCDWTHKLAAAFLACCTESVP